MNPKADRFGMSVALATPFGIDGSILHDKFYAHAKWCLANDCDSVTFFGTTGEGPSLTSDERWLAFKRAVESGISPEHIVVGVIPTTISDAIVETSRALNAGAKAVLLAPPFYFNGLHEDGVYEWFCAVLDGVGTTVRDIILYNIPSLTQVPVSIDMISRLRTKFGSAIRGVKDSSCDWGNTEPLVQAHSDIDILVGDERDLAPAVRLGGSGAIGGLANLFPAQVRDLVEGRDNTFITELVDLIVSEPVVCSIKAIIAHEKSDSDWLDPRLPLLALSQSKQMEFVDKLNILKLRHNIS